MRRLFLIGLMTAWTAAQLPAQLRITGLDGLASKAKESVDITLDSNMLQMAGAFLGGNGKDGKDADAAKLKELLAGLKAITVKTFEFNETGQYRIEDLEPIRAQLRTPGWTKIVFVQEKDGLTEIYGRAEQGKMVGFALIAAEAKELTVIAIDGTINLSDLSRLKGLGIPDIPVPGGSKGSGKKGKQE